MSTKLKLLGVDVASFGDAHARTPGALEVVLSDSAKGTYAKLVSPTMPRSFSAASWSVMPPRTVRCDPWWDVNCPATRHR